MYLHTIIIRFQMPDFCRSLQLALPGKVAVLNGNRADEMTGIVSGVLLGSWYHADLVTSCQAKGKVTRHLYQVSSYCFRGHFMSTSYCFINTFPWMTWCVIAGHQWGWPHRTSLVKTVPKLPMSFLETSKFYPILPFAPCMSVIFFAKIVSAVLPVTPEPLRWNAPAVSPWLVLPEMFEFPFAPTAAEGFLVHCFAVGSVFPVVSRISLTVVDVSLNGLSFVIWWLSRAYTVSGGRLMCGPSSSWDGETVYCSFFPLSRNGGVHCHTKCYMELITWLR